MNGLLFDKGLRQGWVGVLDSGVGGLSVLREIHRLMPQYPTIYYADQYHLPYGVRSAAEIRGFVRSITQFLLAEGASVIVVACNSASAASLHEVRAEFPNIPIVGMEPAVKPAVKATKSGVIGVLTTQATANGPLYKRVLERYARDVRVITQITPELVHIAEHNSANSPESREILRHYVQPMLDAGVDQIALACTHFPFLMDAIQEEVGPDVQLIDPGPAVARQAARVWPKHIAPAHDEHRYFTSGDPDNLQAKLHTLVGIDAPVTGVPQLQE